MNASDDDLVAADRMGRRERRPRRTSTYYKRVWLFECKLCTDLLEYEAHHTVKNTLRRMKTDVPVCGNASVHLSQAHRAHRANIFGDLTEIPRSCKKSPIVTVCLPRGSYVDRDAVNEQHLVPDGFGPYELWYPPGAAGI